MSAHRHLRTLLERLPYVIVAIDLALMLALGLYLVRGGAIVNNAIDIWFDKTDPTLEVLQDERQLFGLDTWMLATVWLRPERLDQAGEVVRVLTEDLERIDGVTRVISPTSLEVSRTMGRACFTARWTCRRGNSCVSAWCAIRSRANCWCMRPRRSSSRC